METTIQTDSKLKEFFVDQLEDLYWAEQKLVKTLPKMQEAATSQQLKDAFANHCAQTKEHVSRLEQVFGLVGEEVDSTKCPAMAGIVSEGKDIIDDTDEGSAQRDVGLIFASQKAEHYEIATYGGMVTLAKTLGYQEAADILAQTLTEEKEADELLTQIAENDINYQASTEQKATGGLFSWPAKHLIQ
ncbi:Ferritin-like metal-binding protein YciE [Mucilaginibacter pineti]|uniref:Ferritin-like metal-binding protein YciE n=1 Tax=Mucilaginibacter pineti TaxID=1391627 RepID=A0A1G7HAC3_9SPHI|nr:ferritin-like domain-containing protein [Mucilaginibacter pineti]SDE97059.1 Ferritin-like metal-binding protein YciE [Mucilaginibacter pineti]